MNTDKKQKLSLICVHLCSSLVLFSFGCGKPNAANIALRKENQQLQDRIVQLEQASASDAAAIRALESSKGTLQTLPDNRLDQLFTPVGLKFGRLSGGARLQSSSSTDDGLKIYVVPTDQTGDEVKAAGSFIVEAFDLNQSQSPLVGRWEFSTAEARKHWYGDALLYEYVLPCPFSAPPARDSLTVHVVFTDELTQRRIEAQKLVKLTLAPAPTTQRAAKVDP